MKNILIGITIFLGVAGAIAFKIYSLRQVKLAAKSLQQGTDEVMIGSTLDLEILPLLSCETGDLDAVRDDLMNDRKANLLVTIEPILPNDKGFKPLAKVISRQGFFKGTKLSFDLPDVAGANHLGIFICKDNNGQGNCGKKPTYNLMALQDRYFFQEERITNDLKAKDKNYFFQYFQLRDGKMSFLTSENTFESVKIQVGKMVQDYLPKTSQGKLQKTIESKLLQLTSFPLSVESNKKRTSIKVKIPGYDEKGCMPEVRKFDGSIRTVKTVQVIPYNLRPAVK